MTAILSSWATFYWYYGWPITVVERAYKIAMSSFEIISFNVVDALAEILIEI